MECGTEEEGFWDGCWGVEGSTVGEAVNAYEFAVKFLFPRLSLVGQGGELRTDARAPRIDS